MASTSLLTSRRARSVAALRLLPWMAPVGMLALWKVVPPGLYSELSSAAIPALVALGVLLVAARRPNVCLILLFALMPYQVVLPAWLYKLGVPSGILRPLTGWRELLGLAIVVAAVQAARREKRRLDSIEVIGLAYVGIVAAYALLPRLFTVAGPIDTSIRSQAFRTSASFVLLLLACRRVGFDSRARELAERALRWTAIAVALFAIWEVVDSDAWNNWIVRTLEVTRYQIEVLNSPPANAIDIRVYGEIGGREFVRASSMMGSPLALGHFMLVPFGLALERALRGRTRGATIQATLIGAALVMTQTRSALLGGAIVIGLVMRRSPGRTEAARGRFWLVLVGLLVAATPFIISTGMLDRFSDSDSTDAHREGFSNGIASVTDAPLGSGLGTSAGVGQRFGTATSVAENYYLQVGHETGAIAMAVFIMFMVVVNRHLRQARDDTGDVFVAGMRSGFFGITVAAFFLHAFNNQTVSWTTFGAAGLALGLSLRPRDDEQPIGANMDPDTSIGSIEPSSVEPSSFDQGLQSQS